MHTVNEPGFRDLMWKAEPKYVVPHRTTFSRGIIPKVFREEKEKEENYIQTILNSVESMTITTDLWSSSHQDSFLAATLQFIVNNKEDDVFVLKHLTIDLIPFPGSHTSERICDAAYTITKTLGVDPEVVKLYIVTDNGSNMVAALEESSLQECINPKLPSILRESKPWIQNRCVDHTLQLAIHDSRKEIGANTVIEKVISIVNRYSWSNIALEKLFKKQEQTKTVHHEIVKNVVTRWNSEFLMLERFLEQKIPITLELAEAGEENLTAQQWKLVQGFVEVLKPIAEFTADLGSTTRPTLSMVIPVLFEIKNCLEDFIENRSSKGSGITLAKILLKNITERFPKSKYEGNPMYQLATILDPRFKDLLFGEMVAVHLLEEAAMEKHRNNMKRGRIQASSETSQEAEESSEPQVKRKKWSHLQKIQRNSDEKILDISNIIHNEVKTYLAMSPIDADKGDAVLWLKSNRKTFPHLVDIAAEYLGIPATEVQSERDFSAAGNTVTPKRTNLLTEHVREMVFLHRNIVVPTIPAKSSDYFHM